MRKGESYRGVCLSSRGYHNVMACTDSGLIASPAWCFPISGLASSNVDLGLSWGMFCSVV